jgi:hypothetical protein
MLVTFLSLFSSRRYSRISALPAYQVRCSKLDLYILCEYIARRLKNLDCSRSPFTRRKALHASLNSGVNKVPLGDITWIRLRDDERKYCMDALQDFCQFLGVLVARLDPCHAWPSVLSGDVLFQSVKL